MQQRPINDANVLMPIAPPVVAAVVLCKSVDISLFTFPYLSLNYKPTSTIKVATMNMAVSHIARDDGQVLSLQAGRARYNRHSAQPSDVVAIPTMNNVDEAV